MSRLVRADLEALDREDRLGPFRERFVLPDRLIYLDGNSLGALPRGTADRVDRVIAAEWGQGLIRSWNTHGWIDLPQRVGDKIGRLVGAPPGTVLAADSTSVNVFKLLAAALELRPGRRVILSEPTNFPTDLYMAEGLIRLLGDRHELRLVEPDAIPAALGRDVAVLLLTHVNYRSGYLHDMPGVTRAAQAAGALIIWDLAHSAGVVPIDLAGCDADFAVGCGYKFLNGGPGAPAFLYVAERLLGEVRMPLTGWLGHAAPFAFETHYRPAEGIARAMVGTPPILSLSALEAGLDILLEAPMPEMREKSQRLTSLFATLTEQECGGHGFRLASPADPARRGSQICLAHEHGFPIMQALIARGIIGDFRAPDILRFGFAPLYNRYTDVWDAVAALREIMRTGAWRDPHLAERHKVT